jgi:AraC-like DNA-binding protein
MILFYHSLRLIAKFSYNSIMKKLVVKVTSGPEHSFGYTHESRKYFFDQFHYHPELELTLIIKGRGTRFVGDHIEKFHEGDVVLIGENLPHLWKSDDEYYTTRKHLRSESISIHFRYDFLGTTFLDAPELQRIKSMLKRAGNGIKLIGKIRDSIALQMLAMEKQTHTQRLFSFLTILDGMSTTKGITQLSSEGILQAYDSHDERIKKVHQYIVSNFKETITLDKIAKIANLSPTSFCRFFKQRTGKAFSVFIAEVRIRYACQLLQTRSMRISEICYESGYSNLSNFNKQFKTVMRTTPLEYRLQFGS